MSPLATIFHGDVTLEQGSDVSQFGWGDLTVNRNCAILSTQNSFGTTSGSLVVYGGMAVSKDANLQQNVNVLYGVTRLTETHIDTTNGPFTVTGGNKVDISVGPSSQFVSTGGNLSIASQTGSLQLIGGLNSQCAIDVHATDVDGGIRVLSGSGLGGISLVSGSGGITGITSSGNVTLVANNANGSFSVNSLAADQNLSLSLNGNTDSQLRIESAGTNVTHTALYMATTHTAGNIVIANADGLGKGSLTQLVGSGGFAVITNTDGAVSITSQAAPSTYVVQANGPNQDLTIALDGASASNSSIVIQSQGDNRAIDMKTTGSSGSIYITQPPLSIGEVSITTGNMGFHTTTQPGGTITMTAHGASSQYSNATTADGQDLYVCVTGETDSRVVICSDGTAADAIAIETSNTGGGVSVSAAGPVSLESGDASQGVQIATGTSGIPVKIGTSNSTTTIYGNLDVKGVTTVVESQTVTVTDNILVVNNAPSGTSDGGLAVKRFQSANNTGTGDVVSDVPDQTGNVQADFNSQTTIHLAETANASNDYYNGWWVKITDGQGMNQVRRIKSYDGSTKVATIYDTFDQTDVLANPLPVEGMDFDTIPKGTEPNRSTYALYPCHFVMAIWDESQDRFALVCSSSDSSEQITAQHYSDLQLNTLYSNAISTSTINGSIADITTYVTLTDNTTTPLTVDDFPNNYGVYLVFVKPDTNSLRTHAIFMIGRINVPGIPGTVVRLISVKGAQYDQLDMQWPESSNPQLFYRPSPGGASTTRFKIKIISV